MKTRFDLEDNIMRCWEIVDDLELVSEHTELSSDEYVELLKALRVLYSLRFTELFSTFEDCIDNKEI